MPRSAGEGSPRAARGEAADCRVRRSD